MNDLTLIARQQYFSAAELADLARDRGIANFPTTKSGVIRFVKAAGWDGSPLCRKRAGRGGGLEYHFSLIPDMLRTAIDAIVVKSSMVAVIKAETEADRRKLAALKSASLASRHRAVMEARAEILTSIDGYAVSMGQTRAWGIARFLEAQVALADRQETEAKRDRGEILTHHEAAGLAQPLTLTAAKGFHRSPERLQIANDRKATARIGRSTIYEWFAARGKGGVVALSPAPTKEQQPIPSGFSDFLKFYALPSKPSISDAHGEYLKAVEQKSGVQNMTVTLSQVRHILRERLSNIEKNCGREGLLTLRSRMAYVTRTDDDMWPTTIYSADGKTFDAEIADPVTKLPIRPEITTVIDIVTRKVVGISLARSENQRSVAEALRNACVSCGIPAIFYTDRGPGYRNDAMDADVSGLMGRLGITKQHAAPYGSQAKGRIERPNGTIWNTLAKRLPTYIGTDMDKEAGQKIHKLTRREIKEFGQSRALPSWDEFVRLCDAMIEEYNNKSHRSLPEFEDPATGKTRHMSPNEAWAAHVASGFEPVPVDADEADDLFRPYEIRTVRRALVQWNSNQYFHEALERYHEEKVMVGYDYHQADRVWVREFDLDSGQPGRLICVARFGGNSERYVPLSYEQKAIETRAKGRLRRIDVKRDAIEAERDAMLVVEYSPVAPVPFLNITPEPQKQPVQNDVEVVPNIAQPRRRTFASDEELAVWALQHPNQLTPNQIAVLKDCLSRPSARELFRLSGIDTEALRTLLRAAA